MAHISVIIPTFNMRRQLVRCLDVLSEQTMKPDEVIVVDDGSVDGTEDWFRQVATSRDLSLRYIKQDHAGASAARNRGFVASNGEYVMFLDADVVLKKHAIERLYETLDSRSRSPSTIFFGQTIKQTSALALKKSQGFASHRSYEGGERREGERVGYAYSSFRWGWKKFSSFPFDAERLRQMPYIHTTSLIKRSALPERPFDENLKRLQDWDLYLTLLERGYGGVHIPEILFTTETRGTMSRWLPSVVFQIPFEKFGIKIERMEKYREAERIIKRKHGL